MEKTTKTKINRPLIAQYIRVYLSNQRKGTASTKTRSDVSGGGKKPWRQKGTGRARHGSIRSPIWRGGGVSHGPVPKEWVLKMPRAMKRQALKSALVLAEGEKRLQVEKSLVIDKISTKVAANYIKDKKIKGTVLLVLSDFNSEQNKKIVLSFRNIPEVTLCRVKDLNAYLVCRASNIFFMEDSLGKI